MPKGCGYGKGGKANLKRSANPKKTVDKPTLKKSSRRFGKK